MEKSEKSEKNNNILQLQERLKATLDSLADSEQTSDLDRAQKVAQIAEAMISNAKVAAQQQKITKKLSIQ